MTASLSIRKLQQYRADTFRLKAQSRVRTQEEAISFVNQRGFVFFWPIRGIVLPSLWTAVAGDRDVASEHDDPGHITWRWKDSLLGARVWYYAKVLRKRATMIALDVVPFFYALSENYGSPEEDYLLQYQQGHLKQETKNVYEALLRESPLDTIALRRAARLSSKESSYRFDRALGDLQADFRILPIGVAEVGAWKYAFVYELVHRYFPELPEQARRIGEAQAREELTRRLFASVGAAQLRDVMKLFGWRKQAAEAAVEALMNQGDLVQGLQMRDHTGDWIALASLLA
ncbi:MAG: crosslink repair DNA glycosylase YcaQ family protein, partial [Anaerolineales bacterium]|jgi:hypothetical protein